MTPTRRFNADALLAEFSKAFKASKQAFDRGSAFFPNGVSQYGRFTKPFPIFIQSAEGAKLKTVDGTDLVDFWQGHFVNVFGHNPSGILEQFRQTSHPLTLQLGCNCELEQEVASSLCRLTGADQAILCTTGAQSTMLATMIGLAHSKRRLVLKIHGGWHGVQPWSVVDVTSSPTPGGTLECAGIPRALLDDIQTIPFNDSERLNAIFSERGDQIGVVIAELVLGNSGMEMASVEFARQLRRLCDHYGAVLILDEIVTGFRTALGPLSTAYGIKPDLATYGKAICGGMPFAAITGRRDVLASVQKTASPRVLADAGTFTSHPATLRAVLWTLGMLEEQANNLYLAIGKNADLLRTGLIGLFDRFSIPVHVTGGSPDPAIPSFPIMTVRYLTNPSRYDSRRVETHWDGTIVDVELRDTYSRLALALRGAFVWQGAGVVTAAHSEKDIRTLLTAYEDWLSTWSEAA